MALLTMQMWDTACVDLGGQGNHIEAQENFGKFLHAQPRVAVEWITPEVSWARQL
jgi:hypothetical protein